MNSKKENKKYETDFAATDKNKKGVLNILIPSVVAIAVIICFCLASLTTTTRNPDYEETEVTPNWGPERPTFTSETPATYPVFNSITDNATIGDERAFVRIAERYSENTLTNDLEVEADKQYVVSIYLLS